jgi:hypothetical protein
MTPADLPPQLQRLRPLGRKSKVVRSLAYAPLPKSARQEGIDGLLAVRLRSSGALYVYAVPAWLYALLRNRRVSAGRVFSRYVRGRKPALKVETPA